MQKFGCCCTFSNQEAQDWAVILQMLASKNSQKLVALGDETSTEQQTSVQMSYPMDVFSESQAGWFILR